MIGLEPPNTAFFAASWLAPTRSAGLKDFAQCWGSGARRGHNGGPQGPLCHWLMAAETSPGWLARRRLDRTRATARRKKYKSEPDLSWAVGGNEKWGHFGGIVALLPLADAFALSAERTAMGLDVGGGRRRGQNGRTTRITLPQVDGSGNAASHWGIRSAT